MYSSIRVCVTVTLLLRRSLGLDRKTIRKYIDLAEGRGFDREMELQPYTWYLELASSIQRGLKTLLIIPSHTKRLLYTSAP